MHALVEMEIRYLTEMHLLFFARLVFCLDFIIILWPTIQGIQTKEKTKYVHSECM